MGVGLLPHGWVWIVHLISVIQDSEQVSHRYRKITGVIVSISIFLLMVGFIYSMIVIAVHAPLRI